MPLHIYNTLTRQKEPFVPLVEGRVNMYVCGPTVYDFPHIGHAKTYISFDVVTRYLRHSGYDVLYVQNITDVGHLTDDSDTGESKIEKRARERRVEPMALVETYTREYFAAMDRLNCLRPDISPRASGHIPEMQQMIQELLEKGHAYESGGNVYFDVESFPEYGKLSRRRLDEQEGSGRVEAGAGKRNPADFALWKNAEGTGHLMNWPSPWSYGFPGWHIECSAMAAKYLGETIDIHGAGVDNIFPHNEDEVAQSECAHDQPFVRYWMHNGTVMVGGEKMSKSKGNFKTVSKELEKFGAAVLRYWVVSHHYRSPVDYTEESVRDAGRALERLQIALQNADRYLELPEGGTDSGAAAELTRQVELHRDQFTEAMDDDFNTPAAVATFFGLATEINRVAATAEARSAEGTAAVQTARDALVELMSVLGLEIAFGETQAADDLTGPLVEMLLEARQALRGHKDYARADEIRGRLAELGITVEDRPGGSTWRRGSRG
ncbi:MAG: cysteine--tRNA ligase [Armatimonadota bacterium]